MFKKNITVSSTHHLSGKDAKELRRSVLKAFPAVSEEQQAALLPPGKASGLALTKLSNCSVVYSLDGGSPLFFDPEGRGTLLPTVYALAVLPHLLPTLHTWSEVSGKVLGGADLFLQGVLPPPGGQQLPDFLAGSPRSLAVPGNPLPFAVGRMAVSRAEAEREGMRGRGWTLLHAYGDLLWAMGDKAPPNEGFTAARILPLADGGGEAGAGAAEVRQAEAGGQDGEVAAAAAAGDAAPEAAGGEAAGAAVAVAAGQLDSLQLGGGEPAPAAAAAAPPGGMSMDALLEAAVLAGLHTLKTAELPIQTGDFYTKHMVPGRPEGVQYDLKNSSYKKLGKLLDKFEKDKVITQKVVRKQDCITGVDRGHPAYLAAAASSCSSGGAGAEASAAAAPAASGSAGAAAAGKLLIEYFYRAPSSLRPVFGEAGLRDKERLYSEAEVAAALEAYAAAQDLAAPASSGGGIQVDALLHGALFNKKEAPGLGAAVPADDLLRRLLDRLQLHHRLVRPGGGGDGGGVEVMRKGQVRAVAIGAERRFGRNITVVSGMEGFGLSPDELASVFQRKFKTSCSVSKLPGKEEKDHEIMLQGDLLKQVAAFLGTEYGIPPALLETKSKAK